LIFEMIGVLSCALRCNYFYYYDSYFIWHGLAVFVAFFYYFEIGFTLLPCINDCYLFHMLLC